MVKIILSIEDIANIPAFEVDAPYSFADEILQAINGERMYNNTLLEFGGLIYEEK